MKLDNQYSKKITKQVS